MAEGELIVDLDLWNSEGEYVDVYADMPPLLPPSSEPFVSPGPMSSLERAAFPTSGPGRATDPKSSPERAPVSPSRLERYSVPELRS